MSSPKKRENTNAIVMFSGGLDSAVALFWAMNRNWKVQALTFNYFRRSKREIEASKTLVKVARCKQAIIDLPFLKEIDDIREKSNQIATAPSAYIPARNIIFYGIASSIAEKINAKYIVAGHNADDVRTFRDSTRKFFENFNRLTKEGLYTRGKSGRVILPLGNLSKKQVVELGINLGVPFEMTWSCYTSRKKPCGICPACRLRSKAFLSARAIDPLV